MLSKNEQQTLIIFIYFLYEILLLTKSSMISLIALTAKMKINGTNVVYRPVGETSGIC